MLDNHKQTSRSYCQNHMRSILRSISYMANSRKFSKAPKTCPWSTRFFHFSRGTISECSALWPFLKPHWRLESILSKYWAIWLLIHLSKTFARLGNMLTNRLLSFSERLPFLWIGVTFANFMDGGKTLVSKDLLNLEYKVSVKMSEIDFIAFVGISESWHAFDESRFNISFSISDFEILLNLKYLFVLLLFLATILGWYLYCSIDLVIGSLQWSIFTHLSWYFGIFRFEISLIKNY